MLVLPPKNGFGKREEEKYNSAHGGGGGGKLEASQEHRDPPGCKAQAELVWVSGTARERTVHKIIAMCPDVGQMGTYVTWLHGESAQLASWPSHQITLFSAESEKFSSHTMLACTNVGQLLLRDGHLMTMSTTIELLSLKETWSTIRMLLPLRTVSDFIHSFPISPLHTFCMIFYFFSQWFLKQFSKIGFPLSL